MPATPNADSEQSTRSASSIRAACFFREQEHRAAEIEPRDADPADRQSGGARFHRLGARSRARTHKLVVCRDDLSGPLKGNLEDGVRMSLMSAGSR